jgi:hypothetical protein
MQQLSTCPRSKSLSHGAGGLVPLEEVFLNVDSTALAAASIAQVQIFSFNCDTGAAISGSRTHGNGSLLESLGGIHVVCRPIFSVPRCLSCQCWFFVETK